MKLTNKAIKAFTYRGGWDVRWDDAIPGFGVRIYPSGKKAFVASYRTKVRKRLMVLGRYGADLTLDQARDAARTARTEVRSGEDPVETRRKAARGETFGDLSRAYVEDYAEPRKKSWKADRQRLERNIPAGWKVRDARAIKQWEVAKLHREIGARAPYEANRLLEIIRRMYNIAPTLIAIDGGIENPTRGVEKFRERSRKRWVKPEELPPLAQAIDSEPNIFVRAAIWLYLLTGARRSELLSARWEDIDWQRGKLRLPDTKSGDEQLVTLNGPALAILQAIP